MAFYSFTTQQRIPATMEEVWDFISSPANLKHITPAYMGFEVLTENLPQKMYPGMIISYRVRPVAGIPLQWVTEITQVRDKEFFVDEQRMGPYAMWHHEHHLKQVDGAVVMTDIVSYIPPLGFLGAIANSLFIRQQLREIFDYRTRKIIERFGA